VGWRVYILALEEIWIAAIIRSKLFGMRRREKDVEVI
jgi:hypothetical protein